MVPLSFLGGVASTVVVAKAGPFSKQAAVAVAHSVEGEAQAATKKDDHLWSARGNGVGALPAGFVPPPSLAPLIKELKLAVVNIATTQVVKHPKLRRAPSTGQGDDPFNQFFDKFFGGDEGQQSGEVRRQSLGSGFIINAKGLVMTNNHVIEDATEIKVKLSDGREFSAEIRGHDPKTDVALLQLKGDVKDLPIAYLGDSDSLEVGDWTLAIGNPFGLDQTVSHGIVSAKERVIGAGPYDDFIQTDAPINPGNSGGPLFNVRGEVIGINTAILSPDGKGSVGIGFAVPINMVKEEIPQLEQTGHVTRGWLGVQIQDLTPDLAKTLKLDQTHGAVVNDVFPNGPAEKGGLKPGDVVTDLNGKKIDNFYQLLRGVAAIPPGGEAKLEVLRDGKHLPVVVKVTERPEDDQMSRASTASDRLGLRVEPVSAQLAHSVGIKEGVGVAVVDVKEDGPAFSAGVQSGDVIIEVNRRPVASVSEYANAVALARTSDPVLLRVQRRSGSLYIAVRAQ
jgi:serine protease Do